MTWDPAQYDRFQKERTQPFHDLLALVRPLKDMRVVDLGCGTGELTRQMHRLLQARSTLGMDSSVEMLEKSTPLMEEGLRFQQGDIGDFTAVGAFDLVFSNAALQWVPGHEALFGRLTAALAPEGQLAVQVPYNHEHLSHQVAALVAQEPPFAAAHAGFVHRTPLLLPEGYDDLLRRLGYREQGVKTIVYEHALASRDEVVEWVKGTLLTAYRRRLAPDLYERFEARYRERLLPHLPDDHPYTYLFPRLFLWARR